MRSTFWANRIFERQSCQNRHTGLKFSSKRENSALSIKFVQNVLFRPCRQVLAKSHFWGSNVWKLLHLSQILSQKGKQCAFHKNCTKRSFQVMRSTFWPNRIFEGQSSQNRHTGLKFSSKRENSALSMKIVQNAIFRWCAAGFGQIAFLRVNLFKIVTLRWNSLQNGKRVSFPWNLYKTLFSGHEQHVLAKSHFWASKLSKSSPWPEFLFKTGKQCAFQENCTKRSFLDHAQHVLAKSHFWASIFSKLSNSPEIVLKTEKQCTFHENCRKCSFQVKSHVLVKSHFWAYQSSQNRHTGLKFWPKL